MNVLIELQKINKSLENIEFDRYCKQCGKRSRDCTCNMGGLKWMAYNKDMRAYPKSITGASARNTDGQGRRPSINVNPSPPARR